MSDIAERLRHIGNAGSTESRVALEAARYIELLEQRIDRLRKDLEEVSV